MHSCDSFFLSTSPHAATGLPQPVQYTGTKKKFFSHSQENCTTAALECFLTELRGTVKMECNDPKEYIDGAIEFLEMETERQQRNLNNNVSTSPHQFG